MAGTRAAGAMQDWYALVCAANAVLLVLRLLAAFCFSVKLSLVTASVISAMPDLVDLAMASLPILPLPELPRVYLLRRTPQWFTPA